MQQPEPQRIGSLHLFVLAGFACAQPVYALLRGEPAFFAARRAQPIDLWVLVLGLSVALPATLATLAALLGRLHRATGIAVHRLAVGVLVALTALPFLKRVPLSSGVAALAGAGIVGLGAGWLYHRARPVRTFFTVLSPMVLVFPALFLLDPSVRMLLGARQQAEVAAADVRTPAPVVFVVFDALPLTSLLDRADRIDAERYPAFAALAADATWYRNASSVSDDTTRALPAILTGRLPAAARMPSYLAFPQNLFTLLGGTFHLEVIEPVTDLCPPPLCRRGDEGTAVRLRDLASDVAVAYLHVVTPRSLSDRLPSISDTWKGFGRGPRANAAGEDRAERFARFVRAIDGADLPALYFVHAMLPHTPYVLLPSLTQYASHRQSVDGQGQQWGAWNGDAWSVHGHLRRHLLQLGATDALLGQLMARLRETGIYDRALIVVTADHGVSFRPGDDRRRASTTNAVDIMSVPLLIKRPGQAGGEIDDRNVEIVDIMPTVAELLGAHLPWPTDGVSLLEAAPPPRDSKSIFGQPPLTLPMEAFVRRRQAAAARVADLIGEHAGNLHRIGPFPELVDRAVADFPIDPADGRTSASLLEPDRFARVDPASGQVPALIEGLARVEVELERPMALAVAVDGRIRATTQTFVQPVRDGLYGWSALVAEDTFTATAHTVDVLRIEPTAGGIRLERLGQGELDGTALGVRLGIEPYPTVRETGFHSPERAADGATFRWTNGRARLVVPVDARRPPTELRIEVRGFAPRPPELTITVNRRQLFRGTVSGDLWSKTFDLRDVPFRRWAQIELASDTFVPQAELGTADRRRLGVPVAGIWLER